MLEYSRDWEKVDEIPYGTVRDRSEYGESLEISSLSRLRGERDYLRALRYGRVNQVIDIVCEYNELNDGTVRKSQPLDYYERYKTSKYRQVKKSERDKKA